MSEVKLKEQHRHSSANCEPSNIKEEPEPCIKEEPEEFPFHMVTVKTEDDDEEFPVLSQRSTEETAGEDSAAEPGCSSDPRPQFHPGREEHNDSSDTDHSEDYSQEQAAARRSYVMTPADSSETQNTASSSSDKPVFTGIDQRPFICLECGMSFRWNSDLQTHMVVHSGQKPHKCPECGKSYTQKGSLTLHMRLHTGEYPFACSACDKRFSKTCTLDDHQRHAHNICPACKTRFQDKYQLNAHLATHVEEGTLDPSVVKLIRGSDRRPVSIVCFDCGKCFLNNSALQRHMTVHTGEKPFQCGLCEKRFTQKASYESHMRIHTGERPHVCSVCSKSFGRKSNLTQHLKTHL